MATSSATLRHFAGHDVIRTSLSIGHYCSSYLPLLLLQLSRLLLVTNWSISPVAAIPTSPPSFGQQEQQQQQQQQLVSPIPTGVTVTESSMSSSTASTDRHRYEWTPPRPGSTMPTPWRSAVGSNGDCHFLVGFLPALSANKGQNKHFVGAFEYALKRINERLAVGREAIPRCRISYETADNKADTAESLRRMTQLYIRGAVAFIGPEDTCATEARLASAWNLPMIAFVSTLMATSIE